jgi:hypothetical protein
LRRGRGEEWRGRDKGKERCRDGEKWGFTY